MIFGSFKYCEMIGYLAGSNHEKMRTLWSGRHGHGEQEYSGGNGALKQCSLGTNKGPKVSKENIPHPMQ